MILIIDGYNVLKNIFYQQRDDLKEQRDLFVEQLMKYALQKKERFHSVIVVFDGMPHRDVVQKKQNGVTVLFSGHKRTADQDIIRLIKERKKQEFLLVTNDKELLKRCNNERVESMNVKDFYEDLVSTQ